MLSQGPLYAGAASSTEWSNFTVARLGTDDASYASCDISGPGSREGTLDTFGFTLPDNAVVTKLTVTFEWYAAVGSLTKLYVTVSNNLALLSENKSSPYVFTADDTRPGWSAADINALSVVVRAENNNMSGYRFFYLDYLSLTVEYYIPATVTTDAVSDITGITATCGGETTDDGSGTISACGVCWNSTGSPTLADSFTTDDFGIGTFVSALTGLFSSSHYYVRSWATTEDGTAYGNEVEFSTLGSSSRSLVARPFTTRAAAAEFVARQSDGIIDWWLEDGVARAEYRPVEVAIPRSRWYVVSRDAPGASVSLTMDSEDTPDIICVVYRTYGVTDVRDGSVRAVYYPAAPTSATQRVELVDLTGQYMGESEATTYAANVWTRTCAETMNATITAVGGLLTVDGQFTPAPLIMAGDWIDVVDLPGHVPTFISGTSYAKASNVVTITTGSIEQRELVIPGMSALPQALTVYGADTAYETYDSGADYGGDDPYDDGKKGPTDPGDVPEPEPIGGAGPNPWTEWHEPDIRTDRVPQPGDKDYPGPFIDSGPFRHET